MDDLKLKFNWTSTLPSLETLILLPSPAMMKFPEGQDPCGGVFALSFFIFSP